MSVLQQVSVQKAGGHNLMSVEAFLALEAVERNRLILDRKVDFLDEGGKVMPLMEAVQQLMRRASSRT